MPWQEGTALLKNMEASVYERHQLTAHLTGLVSGIRRALWKIYSYLFVDVLSGNDTFWAQRLLK